MNTGEFAALCGVEKRTLFHYDQIGLLRPAAVRENGYREYAPEQIYQMDMIKIFQTSGYTLAEIRQILSAGLPERTAHMRQAQERISERIRQLSQMHAYLQSKQDFLAEFQTQPPGTCRIRALTLRYDTKPLDLSREHFFSFLRDGVYSAFILRGNGGMALCKISPDGAQCRTGQAATFFLPVGVKEPNLAGLIRDRLASFDLVGDDVFYIENLPHFLLEDPASALLKVTVFLTDQER